MPTSRARYDREMCYYHLMNRVAGEPGEYPLGDVEKEKLLQLAVELSRFYSHVDGEASSSAITKPLQLQDSAMQLRRAGKPYCAARRPLPEAWSTQSQPTAANLVCRLRSFVAGASLLRNGGAGSEQGCSGYGVRGTGLEARLRGLRRSPGAMSGIARAPGPGAPTQSGLALRWVRGRGTEGGPEQGCSGYGVRGTGLGARWRGLRRSPVAMPGIARAPGPGAPT